MPTVIRKQTRTSYKPFVGYIVDDLRGLNNLTRKQLYYFAKMDMIKDDIKRHSWRETSTIIQNEYILFERKWDTLRKKCEFCNTEILPKMWSNHLDKCRGWNTHDFINNQLRSLYTEQHIWVVMETHGDKSGFYKSNIIKDIAEETSNITGYRYARDSPGVNEVEHLKEVVDVLTRLDVDIHEYFKDMIKKSRKIRETIKEKRRIFMKSYEDLTLQKGYKSATFGKVFNVLSREEYIENDNFLIERDFFRSFLNVYDTLNEIAAENHKDLLEMYEAAKPFIPNPFPNINVECNICYQEKDCRFTKCCKVNNLCEDCLEGVKGSINPDICPFCRSPTF